MVQSICILGFIILSIMSDWDEYWATATADHVNSCPAGKSFSDGVCTDCLAGMYKPGPGLTCSSCQPRLLHKHYKRGGHGPCQLCGQGKYLDFTGAVAETQCKLCPLGPITLSTTILF
ncbi:hypothetical protein TL16_g02668 [Triparma laevis f. inornata]|uniref:Tyrosine-protein kinase ephrin type A/B receptor-like domain-containing protein n=1 Tax=Triparma laevis f. inornata TaxID=1714386 RepID=A0A9W6ZQN4_9STRA|nr:hypothetical protein TL16_g02668 [Triparma laevis f. inornata]